MSWWYGSDGDKKVLREKTTYLMTAKEARDISEKMYMSNKIKRIAQLMESIEHCAKQGRHQASFLSSKSEYILDGEQMEPEDVSHFENLGYRVELVTEPAYEGPSGKTKISYYLIKW